MQAEKSNGETKEAAILVAVRVRPFSEQEKQRLAGREDENGLRKVVHPLDEQVLVFDPAGEGDARQVAASNKRRRDVRFVFDRVYGEESTQREVYEGTAQGLLDAVMGGYNATVFAYGATGCGKTYTISGCESDPGVIVLAMQELFERVAAADDNVVDLALSYLEVYNETIRDLLVAGGPLALREDARQGVRVAGLSEHVPKSVDEVMALMARGSENRTKSATAANEVSSRSHAVLQVRVRQRPRSGGLRTNETMATLSIIDLAGSERATVAGSSTRAREGANINRSLLALANCINALCDTRTRRHVPYRDSKLTRLLKFSLGGNCRTVMITCVSPASTYLEETHNTLKYASRAKSIRTTVARNTRSTNVHVSQYQSKIREQSEEIRRLQRELSALRNRNVPAASSGVVSASAMQAIAAARNRLQTAYAPVRTAASDHALAAAVGRWFDHHMQGLKAWREQFETALQEQQHLHASSMEVDEPAPRQTLAFRQQVDELLRDLARERATVTRHAEHAARLAERGAFTAQRAAQIPASAQLPTELRRLAEQEQQVMSLDAERAALRRHAELADRTASDLASQNSALLKLSATCLCSLRRAIADTTDSSVTRVLEQLYMQAISCFSDVTADVRNTMRNAQGSAEAALPLPYVPISENQNEQPAGVSRNSAVSAAVAGTTRARRPVATGRHIRTSPPKQSQAILPRGAVRFAGPTNRPPAANGRQQPRATRPPPPPTVAVKAEYVSPTASKQSPNPLPSPAASNKSLSPTSSVDSWASAETSPHHEPLPAAARPIKGILKQSSEPQQPSVTGPVRLNSTRRKSRQARLNPTSRSASSPTKHSATLSARELFKSVAATQPKKPVWR
ncbi:tubulin-dependent ATPase kip3 [Coemansia sp. RSA 989]|nr:tubulin-dependent ATPase kip3 [Coemansia sp. RSA 1821]KAJ1865440.1 tubulin-dependent ATPase kip3 [Coemansia sp. RSA 989]KAJ1872680.1 tubulin-dependent ATPase kip3 [Coemansia sp. RSA 990]KAJ2628977.1 tubulin-dependent ATPase kip3 [Coemansia sp. RSA 1290]KAJ2653189.1 tubulin-dependent ATPase kip3 [Coemansia sp. RSA 1250]KAJ2674452.1 tubulin-dependent ATPase kip3 [Coemansia sp. RSA 1085]